MLYYFTCIGRLKHEEAKYLFSKVILNNHETSIWKRIVSYFKVCAFEWELREEFDGVGTEGDSGSRWVPYLHPRFKDLVYRLAEVVEDPLEIHSFLELFFRLDDACPNMGIHDRGVFRELVKRQAALTDISNMDHCRALAALVGQIRERWIFQSSNVTHGKYHFLMGQCWYPILKKGDQLAQHASTVEELDVALAISSSAADLVKFIQGRKATLAQSVSS